MRIRHRLASILFAAGMLIPGATLAVAQDTNGVEVEVVADASAILTVYFTDSASGTSQISTNYEFATASITGLAGTTVAGNAFLYVEDARLDDNTGFELSVLISSMFFTGDVSEETFPASNASITNASALNVLTGDTPTVGANATSGPLTTTRIVLEADDGTNTETVQTLAMDVDVPAGTTADTYIATLQVTVVNNVAP